MSNKASGLAINDREELRIDAMGIKKVALLVRAANHSLRQQLLRIIDQEGSVKVTVLCKKLKLVQPVVSSHLAVLRKAGMVTTKREGRVILYSLNYTRVVQLNRTVSDFLTAPS